MPDKPRTMIEGWPHACDLPLDPEHGDEFPCYGCETLWEWNATENEWEGIGEAIEEVEGVSDAG